MLFEFFNFALENGNFGPLAGSGLNDILEILIEYLILISLSLNSTFEHLVIPTGLSMQLILNNFGLLHQDVHPKVYFCSDPVGFVFEKLQHVVACY